MQKVIERKIVVDCDDSFLIDVLSNNIKLSKQVLKLALDKGCVWLKVGKKNKPCSTRKEETENRL